MITLNDIELPDGLVWPGQTDYCAIKQQNEPSITGVMILSRGRMQDGRPITLVGNGNAWTTKKVAIEIGETRINPALLSLNYNGKTFKVRWDYSQSDHFVAKHLHDNDDEQTDDTPFIIETIKLIEVLD